ncbi:MAG: exopolyphosphatase [Desulfobacteraceae bacterium]|nr:MAG: exopolyphosphatase [Desulfobacteraceae bacterium]
MESHLERVVMTDKVYKYAAIDIGSNAVRLLLAGISKTKEHKRPKKISWIRLPIRLGQDAFLQGEISTEQVKRFEHTLTGFKYLIKAFEPRDVMACATAAMRAAKNGKEICERIREKTDIPIRIIDGKEEARILFKNRLVDMVPGGIAALCIDVGGGSTEMTIFFDDRIVASRSFNIGTIRLLNQTVDPSVWEDMKVWLEQNTKSFRAVEAVGSGGNINKMFRLVGGKSNRPVAYDKVLRMRDSLNEMSLEQRIDIYNLRPDRADVIVPGSDIYLRAMAWADCQKIHVPMLGLADGMVRVMHDRYRNGELPDLS